MTDLRHDRPQRGLQQASEPLSPFLILGAPRSGTSLLSRMLDHHCRIAVPGETKAFAMLDRLIPLYGDLSDPANLDCLIDDMLSLPAIKALQPPPDRAAVAGALERSDLGGVLDALLGTWARSRGKARWGEKTPGNAMYWQSIRRYFPDARVIHVIRDGRDVALSLQAAPFGPKNVYMAAARWVQFVALVRAIGRTWPDHRYLEIHYEDLLARPQATLTTSHSTKACCSFTRIPISTTPMKSIGAILPNRCWSATRTSGGRP